MHGEFIGCERLTAMYTLLNTTWCSSLPAHSLFIGTTRMFSRTPLLLLTKAVIFLLCCLGNVHGITEYYVKPTEFDNTSCPGEPCHTLNHFASNTHYAWSGVVVRFLPGNHSLNQSLYISSSSNLHLTSFEPVTSIQNLSVIIHCPGMGNLYFYNVSNVTIHGLSFYHYGIPLQSPFMTPSALYFRNVANFCIDYIKIQSWFKTIRIRNGFGRSVISHSEFSDLDCRVSAHAIDNHLTISKSTFKRSGLFIHLKNVKSNIQISDSIFTSSRWMAIYVYASQSTVVAHIRNSLVTGGMRCALYFKLLQNLSGLQVTIKNSIITNNIVSENFEGGAGMTVYKAAVEQDPIIIITNVSFLSNEKYGIMRSAIIALYYANHVTFTDCKFYGNRGTAIGAYMSTFNMNGYNSFINNSATEGGAIALLDHSSMRIQNNAEILFQSNYADIVGGAIFVHTIPTFDIVLLSQKCPVLLSANITLTFTNNTGRDGGDVIYTRKAYTCESQEFSLWHMVANYKLVHDGMNIRVDRIGNDPFSILSSDPMQACFCTNGTPNCTAAFIIMTKYPGEAFNIPAVVVGENFGTVTGSVRSKFLPLDKNRAAPNLEVFQHFQKISRSAGCSELHYTVLSENEKEVMVLTAQDVQYGSLSRSQSNTATELLTYPVYINITLLPCPLGFMLHNSQHRCVCHSQLEEHNIACNISDQTVHRSGYMWLNASFAENTTNRVILHSYCPFDYCKPGEISIKLEDPDSQCAFSRAGILCGGCRKGLSLALGSSQCLSCSNIYLTLLIPFAMAGFVLVFFLTFLNVTVSQGTINGLIFYANILKANEAVFFPPGDTNILTVFISWMNLDLGIETCFIDGLNGYWKTWLQFVFPLYIWGTTATVIIASHYSSTAAKMFGNNSVPVLATLFLLSYTKLLRTIITTFTFTFLNYHDGSRKAVWSYDGNVSYFSVSHTLLFLVAMAFLLFLWLPYTGILLLKQFLQKYTNHKWLRWITKMKPFFDAHFGPFKNKHGYWFGIMLLFRVKLFLVYAITQTNPNIGLLVTAIVGVLVLLRSTVIGNVYKKHYLSILEMSFILNLTLLSLTTLYIRANGGNQAALVYTAAGTAFAQFVAIVFYHVLMKRELRQLIQRWHLKLGPNRTADKKDTESETLNQQEVIRQPTHSIIALHELREPLLTN